MTLRSLLFAGLLAAAATPAVAQDGYGSGYDQRSGYCSDDRREVRSVTDFEAPLAQYGRWVKSRFGRAWAPRVGRDWRPYTIGRWVQTEDGETWESDEPWGWATYHYGRWGFDETYGWVWTPDTEWAPAWVAWRDGDDYAGWAPLPPQAGYGSGYQDWDYSQWYAPSWIYVERSNLYRRDLGRTVLPWRGNRGYWDRTREQHASNGRNDRHDWSNAGYDGRAGTNGSYGGRDLSHGGSDGRNWSNDARDGRQGRQGGDWSNRQRPGDGTANRPTPPNGNTGIVPPPAARPDRPAGDGGWNGGARPWRTQPGVTDRPVPAGVRPQLDGQRPGWTPTQRSGRPELHGEPQPGRGREGTLIAPDLNAGRGGQPRPVPQAMPQPQPRPQVQAPPQPQPQAQPQPQRADRPARADNPRRERDNRQPE